MKIGIIGSRDLHISEFEKYLPSDCDEIVSGGARGIDRCAEHYAIQNRIPLVVFHPDYERFGRGAPLIRNKEIVRYADQIFAFWDGSSHGTKHVIDYCKKIGKPCVVIYLPREKEV